MVESRLILILSLVISFLIFLYVKFDKEIRVSLEYGINIESSPYIKAVSNVNKVVIEYSAKARDLIVLSFRKRVLNLNLDFERAGNFKIPLREYLISEPYLKVMKIDPETLVVLVEKIVQKQREVKVNIKGEFDSVMVEPKFVNVVASESQLIGISYIETEEIDVSNMDRGFELKVALKKPFKDVKIEPESVLVRIKISPKN